MQEVISLQHNCIENEEQRQCDICLYQVDKKRLHGVSVCDETDCLLLILFNQAYDLTELFRGDLLLFGKERDQLFVGIVEVALHYPRQKVSFIGCFSDERFKDLDVAESSFYQI